MLNERLLALRQRVSDNATNCIFPFWTSEYLLDKDHGGFYSRITLDMERSNTLPRSLVLAGRMVYAFSLAYLHFKKPIYLERAKYAFQDLITNFYDKEFGGGFNSVSCDGAAIDSQKPLYSEAFFIMACAAFYSATQDSKALRLAMETFDIIETKVKLGVCNYPNSCSRSWDSVADGMQGKMHFPKDAFVFPHHLCQAYVLLYRATGDLLVKNALGEMAKCIPDLLYDADNHCFCTLFDKDRKRLGTHQSYGHDCELSYLAMDIAKIYGDAELEKRIAIVCKDVLQQVLFNDFDHWHSLYNGIDLVTKERPKSHVWWAQAEAVTAMLFGYQLTTDEAFLTACEQQLDYIDAYFVNKKNGDWYNNIVVDDNGCSVVDGMHGLDKLNDGKCPFHNSHMCFEVISRIDKLLEQPFA